MSSLCYKGIIATVPVSRITLYSRIELRSDSVSSRKDLVGSKWVVGTLAPIVSNHKVDLAESGREDIGSLLATSIVVKWWLHTDANVEKFTRTQWFRVLEHLTRFSYSYFHISYTLHFIRLIIPLYLNPIFFARVRSRISKVYNHLCKSISSLLCINYWCNFSCNYFHPSRPRLFV